MSPLQELLEEAPEDPVEVGGEKEEEDAQTRHERRYPTSVTSVVVGIPVRNGERWLAEALDSLLSQTPCPGRGRGRRRFLERRHPCDPPALRRAGRIASVRSEERLGLVEAWRRAYAEARKHRPSAAYFAWGSDHDRWEAGGLAALVAELDAHPDAVLAYPHVQRIGEDGSSCARPCVRSTPSA